MPSIMLTDLWLTRRSLDSESSDRSAVDLQAGHGDRQLVSGRANLAQAILNRLLTRQGELKALGHPSYGSRLYRLIGEPNTRRTQALADLYIRESLAAEARIAAVVAITFAGLSRRADQRNRLVVHIIVQPVADDERLTLPLTINLEG